jgi:hypothetical protein
MSNYYVKLMIIAFLPNVVITMYPLASASKTLCRDKVGSMHALCLANLVFKFGPGDRMPWDSDQVPSRQMTG